jgi:transcription initiation factor IIE alpha subunit
MFFTECARLAEQHPDLASVFERLDSQLRAMGTAEVVRPDDLASFLNIDPNKMRSALVMFAQEGVLHRVEMIECPYCQMAALRSEYQEALDEDDEYRCTSCERRLTEKTIHTITTYRRGEKWQEVSNLRDGSGDAGLRDASASSASIVTLDEQGWYTHVRLAESFSVGKEALRKRLDRYREHKLDGWKRQDDRRPREPKYLYRLQDVKGVIQELASSERPAN